VVGVDLDDAGHASTVPRAAEIRPTPGPVADRQPRPARDCSPWSVRSADSPATGQHRMIRDAFADDDGGST
jgi:hypothetical protein